MTETTEGEPLASTAVRLIFCYRRVILGMYRAGRHGLSRTLCQNGGMDATTPQNRQASLKELYRAHPDAARTPLSATATFEDPGITCTVQGWGAPVRAGLHPATGGDGGDACSGDMLLEALLACSGVTLRSVAAAMELTIRSAALRADGVFDARGTLGLDRSVAVGAQEIVVTAEIDADVDEAALERLARSTERYCVVGQSLREPVRFVVRRAAT
jgi:uncharacterized OsmC-like protein